MAFSPRDRDPRLRQFDRAFYRGHKRAASPQRDGGRSVETDPSRRQSDPHPHRADHPAFRVSRRAHRLTGEPARTHRMCRAVRPEWPDERAQPHAAQSAETAERTAPDHSIRRLGCTARQGGATLPQPRHHRPHATASACPNTVASRKCPSIAPCGNEPATKPPPNANFAPQPQYFYTS